VTSHVALMALFALMVSIVFGALMRDTPAEQIRFGGRLFASFIGFAVLAGWILYFLPL
jgi:hypothetical protein